MGCVQSSARYMYKNKHKAQMAAAEKKKKAAESKKPATPPSDTTKADIRHFGRLDRYMCDICGEEGLTDIDMRSHVLLEHVENQISCPFCDLEGTTLEEMTLHVNSQHLDVLTPAAEDNDRQEHKTSEICQQRSSQTQGSGFAESGESSNSTVSSTGSDEQNLARIDSPQSDEDNTLADNHHGAEFLMHNDSTPKRARLYLEVPQVVIDKPQNNSPSKTSNINLTLQSSSRGNVSPSYSCPLCGWGSDLSEEVTRHVNVVHLDVLTPTKVTDNKDIWDQENNNNSSTSLECPLCGWTTNNGSVLELHVNQTHRDELGSPEADSQGQTPGSPSTMCPMCGMECSDTDSLMRHVDGHFSNQHTPGSENEMSANLAQELQREQQQQQEAAQKREQREFQHLQDKYGTKSTNNNYRKQAEKNMERAICSGQLSITDFYMQRSQIIQAENTGVDDGHSCTRGIIQSLHQYYKTSPNGVEKHWLCSSVDHYAASYGDKGWGCGYRNLQMLLSSLATEKGFEEVLFNGRPTIPSIPKIQRLIEAAWQKGFDHAGCEQLGGKVVNTSKWIGATEIVATLSSLKVKCQLVDFHTPTGNGGTHPRLMDWVKQYFNGTETFKAPLYLQHQGHSRTIAGLEQTKDGSLRLLMFDPSCRRPQMSLFLQDITPNLMRTLRRPINSLKARQYQIVAVLGVLSDKEYQESKMLKSEQVP